MISANIMNPDAVNKDRGLLTRFCLKHYFEVFAGVLFLCLTVFLLGLDLKARNHDLKIFIFVGVNAFMLIIYLIYYCLLRIQLNAIKDVELNF